MGGAARKQLLPKQPKPVATATTEVFDDELVIYCERTERMHCLDRSASVVWALCDGERDVDAIVAVVAEIWNLEADAVGSDVRQVIRKLCALELLR